MIAPFANLIKNVDRYVTETKWVVTEEELKLKKNEPNLHAFDENA